MYPPAYAKSGALPRASIQLAGTESSSHSGYALQWVSDGKGLDFYTEEIQGLLQSSGLNNISVRPDWRATLSRPEGWREAPLLLRHNGVLEALVFLREKLVAGLRTGYFQGTATLGDTLILCDSGCETFYLSLVAELLLNRDRGFLLLLQRPVAESQDLDLPLHLRQNGGDSLLHWELPLRQDLETTIQDFSHRTRRNIRSSLRHVDSSGWRFHPRLDDATMQQAVRDLAGRSTHPFSEAQAEERLQVAANTPGSFAMGLTGQDGTWLCCLVGRRTGQATEIFWQLNAAGPRKVSLCIAMRSLMTREEVRRKVPVIRYIGGTCALSLPTTARYTSVARPGFRLWLLRLFVRLGILHFPVLGNLI